MKHEYHEGPKAGGTLRSCAGCSLGSEGCVRGKQAQEDEGIQELLDLGYRVIAPTAP